MAWEAIKAAIPPTLIQIIVEKLISLLIPAAAAVMLIIETLQAAWGTIQRVLEAFERFFAFLKAVRTGKAGPQFATAIAAAAIAVIDFVANWLLKRLRKPAGKIAKKLKAIAKKLGKKLAKVGKGHQEEAVRRQAQEAEDAQEQEAEAGQAGCGREASRRRGRLHPPEARPRHPAAVPVGADAVRAAPLARALPAAGTRRHRQAHHLREPPQELQGQGEAREQRLRRERSGVPGISAQAPSPASPPHVGAAGLVDSGGARSQQGRAVPRGALDAPPARAACVVAQAQRQPRDSGTTFFKKSLVDIWNRLWLAWLESRMAGWGIKPPTLRAFKKALANDNNLRAKVAHAIDNTGIKETLREAGTIVGVTNLRRFFVREGGTTAAANKQARFKKELARLDRRLKGVKRKSRKARLIMAGWQSGKAFVGKLKKKQDVEWQRVP